MQNSPRSLVRSEITVLTTSLARRIIDFFRSQLGSLFTSFHFEFWNQLELSLMQMLTICQHIYLCMFHFNIYLLCLFTGCFLNIDVLLIIHSLYLNRDCTKFEQVMQKMMEVPPSNYPFCGGGANKILQMYIKWIILLRKRYADVRNGNKW